MQSPHNPGSSGRESLLTVVLTGLVAGGILFFLILVSGGFFFYVVLAVAAMVGLGFFHYMAWGYSMTQEVMEEQRASFANLEEPELNYRYNSSDGIMARQAHDEGERPGPDIRIK
jgi:hypothetical protein